MNFSFKHLTLGKKLNPALESVLSKLAEKYGERLVFLSLDTNWVNFEVRGLTDECLIRELEREQNNLIDNISNFQIVMGLEQGQRGIFLRHESSLRLLNPQDSGFWYY